MRIAKTESRNRKVRKVENRQISEIAKVAKSKNAQIANTEAGIAKAHIAKTQNAKIKPIKRPNPQTRKTRTANRTKTEKPEK